MINNVFGDASLADVLEALKNSTMVDLNVMNIGEIVSFDATNQTAQVKVLIKRIDTMKEDGTILYQAFPTLLQNVPVMVLFGGTGYLTMPITAGDSCLLLYNDREIDQWFANGGWQAPITQRVHDVSDAVAIVGINSLQKSIASYLTAGVRLAFGDVTISLTAGEIASVAALFLHTGDMHVTGTSALDGNVTCGANISVAGQMSGNGGTLTISDNIVQSAGKTLAAGNGASGTFTTVTVVDGIVTSGT